MLTLANHGSVMCRHCDHPIAVNRWWQAGIYTLLLSSAFMSFQFEFPIVGTILLFPTILLTGGLDIYAVRWFPLKKISDDRLGVIE